MLVFTRDSDGNPIWILTDDYMSSCKSSLLKIETRKILFSGSFAARI